MDRFWKYKVDHVLFWVATVGFHMFTKADLAETAGVDHFLLEIIVRNGLLASLIYLNLEVLIPKYAQRRRIASYSILLLVGMALYVLVKNAYDVYLYGYVLDQEAHLYFYKNTYYNLSIAVFYVSFSVALQLSKAWYFQRDLIRKMELEKVNTELEYLKAQINPHFLFNSINTIYFQIDRQNAIARNSLSGFSDMLRYQLYECNGSEIAIEKEIRYLKNYVALQRMRKDESYNIAFEEDGDLTGFNVPPLLLIPFVENAFKHVSHHQLENEIRIKLARCAGDLRLSVFNTKEKSAAIDVHTGIGLRNVRRRLDLLYKDLHELRIDEGRDTFQVNLCLKIIS